MAKDYMDIFLEILDEDDDSANEEGFANMDNVGEGEHAQVDQEAVAQPIPASPIRSIQVLRYLSSSSAKKRQTKPTHCHYCQHTGTRYNLLEHLNQSERCSVLYQRRLHVKCNDAVMALLFQCSQCEERVHRLQHHLENSPDCFNRYSQHFNLSTPG